VNMKAAFFTFFALLAFLLSGTPRAAAADELALTLDQGEIAVLPELLGPVPANPPAGQAVTIRGLLAPNGDFTAKRTGFSFPTQTIPLPSGQSTAAFLGDHVDVILGAREPFQGQFDRNSGAFTASVPLALTLKFSPPPPAALACTIPFTLNASTSGVLTFPGKGEGGGDLSFPAAPFAPPAGTGALYGSWPAVAFTDIQDGPGMEPGGTQCATLLEMLPAVVPNWPAGLRGIEGQIWLAGKAQVNTVPDVDNSRIVSISAPERVTVKPGGTVAIRVRVRNAGSSVFRGRLAVKSSNKQVSAPAVNLNVGPGKTRAVTVVARAGRKARGKAALTFTAGGRKTTTTVTVR